MWSQDSKHSRWIQDKLLFLNHDNNVTLKNGNCFKFFIVSVCLNVFVKMLLTCCFRKPKTKKHKKNEYNKNKSILENEVKQQIIYTDIFVVNCTKLNFQEFPECPSEPSPVPSVHSATIRSGNERDRKQVRANSHLYENNVQNYRRGIHLPRKKRD